MISAARIPAARPPERPPTRPPAPLWTAAQIAAATGGQAVGAFDASGVSIDTRTLMPGDLFIALQGPRFDGHDFVREARARGAVGILAATAVEPPHVRVADTTAALTALGAEARARFTGQLIALTGSVGKTTTRSLAQAAFASFCKVHSSEGNLNNHLGVPLTLARMPQDTDVAILEMGMNHFGEIAHLSRLAQPHRALITALDWVHSQNLDGTLAGVARAKAEIAQGLSGPLYAPIAIRPLLDPALKAYAPLDVRWIEAPFEGPLALFGEGHRWNAALALAAVPVHHRARAAAALARVEPEPGRGRAEDLMIDGKPFTLIDDAYNAAPASMRAAIDALRARKAGRKIAVLGDMAEVANARQAHEILGKFLAESPPDMVVAVGEFHSSILTPLPASILTWGRDGPEGVAALIRRHLQPGDQVLIKASNSTNLRSVVSELKAMADR